ncbi:MAG TPA: DUF433 domain-containing protein [Thermoanaerobaculia bacterium]
MVGRPVIAGTRLTVEFIVERLADGWSEEDLLQKLPGIDAGADSRLRRLRRRDALRGAGMLAPFAPACTKFLAGANTFGTFDFRPEPSSTPQVAVDLEALCSPLSFTNRYLVC